MSKKNAVDWQGTADALDGLTDEEIAAADKILNPSGMTAGEEAEYALKRFIEMGLIPGDDE